ncbi:MAG: twitch domain-containing radical SAM protein [Vicinamibacterales bacterium]
MSDPVHEPSPTFCIIPWIQVFGDERGLLRPCCMTQGQAERELRNLDEHGQEYTIHGPDAIARGWNSPFMRELRRDMLEGTQPAVCARCFNEEALGIESYRQDANKNFASRVAGAAAATTPDGAAPLDLVCSADFRLGNACNLKCRMCSPVSTKLLIPEFKKMFNLPDDQPELVALERVDWFDQDTFWDNCARLMPSLDQLHFAGGEPMIINRMLDFLESAAASGHAGRIRLSYVTNLTTLPDRVTSLWPSFRGVQLTVSLDGHEPINSLIRYPARWDRIETHLARLTEAPERYNLDSLTFNTTVQMYNVLYLADLFEHLLTRHHPKVTPYPRLSLLHWPASFDIQVLPAELKAVATDRLRAFVQRWTGRWPVEGEKLDRFLHAIDGVIEHMHQADRSGNFAEFARRTAVFDESRGHDTGAVIPEFAALLAAASEAAART